ncbi:MAG: STT3 domain-containing protein [Methanobacteriaceae archaeon]|nr:STT3 domain-containing protein [Methanobacteriaceae archaeon]
MSRKEILIQLGIILLIFLVGFIVRIDNFHTDPTSLEDQVFQDQNGLPYMHDMDSYYNYRLTRNLLDHGYLGDQKLNGIEWDSHSYYPPGVPLDYPPLIAYLSVFTYYLVNLFSEIPLLWVCFWLPAFIAPLAGIIGYLFVKRITNNYGALAAGLLLVLAPIYYIRTVPGFFDTDIFNLVFPLLVVWFFWEAIESTNLKNQLFFSTLAAIFMFLFSLAWNGWQYLFYLILFFCIIYSMVALIKGIPLKKFLYTSGIFFASSIILIAAFNGFLNIIKIIMAFSQFSVLSTSSLWAPWPNIYPMISELQKPSLIDIVIGTVPGLLIVLLVGILLMLLTKRSKGLIKSIPKNKRLIYFFILFWTFSGLLALLGGIRFLILLIAPLAIISGILVGWIADHFSQEHEWHLNCLIPVLMVVLVTIPSLFIIYDNYIDLKPTMNDDMWNSGEWIHNNTPNNTVVISSWVYGHFFSTIADRPVIFDGRLAYVETVPTRNWSGGYPYGVKSPSTSREYWINHAFSTSNETLSLGIFRMLTSSGDQAGLKLDEITQNTTKSVEILNQILGVEKETARTILLKNYTMTSAESEEVLKYTHPAKTAPWVLVTYDYMIGAGYWMLNSGEWDFNQQKLKNFLYSYGNIEVDVNSLKTDDGFNMDLKTWNSTWNDKIPYGIIMIKNKTIEKRYFDQKSDFIVVLLLDLGRSVVIDKHFENSTFTKLVLERNNSPNFKILYENNRTAIWGINEV